MDHRGVQGCEAEFLKQKRPVLRRRLLPRRPLDLEAEAEGDAEVAEEEPPLQEAVELHRQRAGRSCFEGEGGAEQREGTWMVVCFLTQISTIGY